MLAVENLSPAKRRALSGLAFVEKVYPDSINKIDLGTLDIGHTAHCMLAKASGTSWSAAKLAHDMSSEQATAYGFLEDDIVSSDELTAAFKELILERRGFVRIKKKEATATRELEPA